jgi:hypothetical protein
MPSTETVVLGSFLELLATLCQSASLLQHIKSLDPTCNKTVSWGWWCANIVYGVLGTFLGILALGMAPLSLLVPIGTFQIVALELFEHAKLVENWAFLKGDTFVVCCKPNVTPQELREECAASGGDAKDQQNSKDTGLKIWPLVCIMLGISVMLVATQVSEIPHPLETWTDSMAFFFDIPAVVSFSLIGIGLAVLVAVPPKEKTNSPPKFWSVARASTVPALLTAVTRILLSSLLDAISTNTAETGEFIAVASVVVAAAIGQFLSIGTLFSKEAFQFTVPVYYSLQATAVFLLDLVVFQRYAYYSLEASVVTGVGFLVLAVGLYLVVRPRSSK